MTISALAGHFMIEMQNLTSTGNQGRSRLLLVAGLLGAACAPTTRTNLGANKDGGTADGAGNSDGAGGAGGRDAAGDGGPGGGAGGTVDASSDPGIWFPPAETADCEMAKASHSYIGCEFWPTITYNPVWTKFFDFAVVVANGTASTANVVVYRGSTIVTGATVAPGTLQAIKLPWITELKNGGMDDFGPETQFTDSAHNVRLKQGAYRLKSDTPITAYQFSALEYESLPTPPDCSDALTPGHCFSWSNDASLLFPTGALTSHYVVTGFANDGATVYSYSTFVSVTATQDGTPVTIEPTGSSANRTGDAFKVEKGKPFTLMLDAGEVIAFVDSSPDTGSLSGTYITSPKDKPIQVLSGAPCQMIPNANTGTCDHIEESVLPVEAFGKDYLVTVPTRLPPLPSKGMRHSVRVQSAFDGTTLNFDPPAVHAPVTLAKGEVLSLVGVSQDFRVWSDAQAFGVTQYMHGGDEIGAGDPSQSTSVPTAQFRRQYIFLAPNSYDTNYVNIVAPPGTNILLDGVAIPAAEFKTVGTTGTAVARHLLDRKGAHDIRGDQPFGIVVYGYGQATSYMYPGGLGLDRITTPPCGTAGC